MAEIGLIGSIFSVAAVGVSVATTLYDVADVMIHANQQILDLAKHVSQFTAVLKHMGQVLESEKANCSKDVLHDIRKIKRSSKRTFKEINFALESKRFRHFVSVRWLFKKTKAMELQKRLDSQQSMLQCIIHTLTVSKLSHMDTRSKKDSEHITGLKAEIRLLKTFIMESYNNLTELRRAEQSTEAELRFDFLSRAASHPGARHSYGDSGNTSSIPAGRSNVFEPPTTWSSPPRPSASDSDKEDPDSDGGADDDASSTTSTYQNDKAGALGMYTANAEGLITKMSQQPFISSENDILGSKAHRESNILLQMTPYRPRLTYPIRSDHLICDLQNSNGSRASAKEEATNSVRLLLDKWTNSGSAPISSILDEEAAREKDEAHKADRRRTLGSQSNAYRRSPSPGAEFDEEDFGPQRYPGYHQYSSRLHGDYAPSPRLMHHPQPQNEYLPYTASLRRHKDFWKSSYNFPQLSNGQLGVEILATLRSTPGGIYYSKSNQFQQVHFVDQRPIYTCAFVPPHMMPYSEWKPLNTELDRGLVRREALDLLGYSYTEIDMGKFSISGDLELRDIEELVKLSYQALDRNLRERSKAVIKERGWAEAINAINRDMPPMYPYEPPPMAEYWNSTEYPYNGYTGNRPNTDHENNFPIKTSSQLPRQRPREHERDRPKSHSVSTPQQDLRQEREASKPVRPEVRFTLPGAQLVSSATDTTDEFHASQPKSNVPETSKTDEEIPKLRKKLEEVIKKREEWVRSGDHATAADLTYYAIPELEQRIEVLKERQRREQAKHSAPRSGNERDRKSHRTEVETESEDSDDDGISEIHEVD